MYQLHATRSHATGATGHKSRSVVKLFIYQIRSIQFRAATLEHMTPQRVKNRRVSHSLVTTCDLAGITECICICEN